MSRETIQCAVMFADVAGSTSIYDVYGNDTAKAVIGECINKMAELTLRHNGIVIKTIGDEIMCRFKTAVDAVDTAIAIQESMNVPVGDEKILIAVRIGLHAGDAILENDDVFGDAVNVAARMAGIARARQIITTQDTYRQLSPELQDKAREFDITAVKGKSQKITIYDILWEEDDVTTMAFSPSAAPQDDRILTFIYDGRDVVITPDNTPMTIGRGSSCDLTVEAPLASRSHIKVDYSRGKFILADQSTNGTYVKLSDGQEVYLRREELPLSSMGKISLGEKVEDTNPLVIQFLVS
jgi:class 3 adenylate cyclase